MPVLVDKSWYERPEGVPTTDSAGAVVIRLQEGVPLVALIRERSDSHYVLPKGHVEAGESREEAAIREVEEEAGLSDLNLVRKLGQRERLGFDRTEWKVTHYFLFETEQVRGIPLDSRTIGEVEWFPVDELPPMFWPEQQELLEQHRDLCVSLSP